MQDYSCKRCGQSFKSDRELEEHTEKTHGGGKMGGEPMSSEDKNLPR